MSTGRRRAVKMGKIFGVFAAVIFIALGVYFLFLQKESNKDYSVEVTAVVTEVKIRRDPDDRDRNEYRAECEYEVNGQSYSYTTDWRDNRYYEGDEITISVDPDDPSVRNRHRFSTAGWICFCLAGIALYFNLRK